MDHPDGRPERTGDEVVVRTCGGVRVEGPRRTVAVRGGQPQVVLAHLALEGGRCSRDRLAEVVWGEVLSEHWPGALRGIVSKVRAALVDAGLPSQAVRIDGGSVHLDPPGGWRSDVAQAEGLVADAEDGLATGHPAAALDAALAAQATTTQPFLEHHDDDWSRHQRRRLADLTRRGVHAEIAALLDLGRPEDAAARARQRLVDEPLDERAHHLLVAALVAGGRRGAATQAVEDLRRTLRAELGVGPAPETVALLDAAPRRTPRSRRPGPATTATPPSPTSRRTAGDRRAVDFVGRAEELDALEAHWAMVVASSAPQVVVLEGPPGAGKTRLAERFAERRAAAGDRVLWGRGRADAGLAYGPFAEALDGALRAEPDVLGQLGPHRAGLAALLPHLADQVGAYHRPEDDALARTHLFAAVGAAVERLADRPCLLVLDDLQWAGPDAMALLEATLDGLRAPLLVLASTRPTGGSQARALASLQRVVDVATLPLGGLRADALAELLVADRLAPGTDRAAVAAELLRRTGGLPFYVADIVRDADRRGGAVDPSAIPTTTRAWIVRRTAGLADVERDLLEAAAVLDEPFDPEVVAGRGAPVDVARLVDEGLLAIHDDGSASLAHELTREAVYDHIDPHRRARLHRRIADVLDDVDARGRPRRRPDHAALAHHRRRAGARDGPRAARHALAAGLEALDQGAWERAAELLGQALDEEQPPTDRARTLVAAGRAHHLLGDHERARRELEEALAVARKHHLAVEQAEATLALVGRAGRGAAVDAEGGEQVALLRRAVADLEAARPDPGAEDDRRRAVLACRLDAELAMALLLSDAVSERADLLARARRRARALDPPSPAATAWALLAGRYGRLGPTEVDLRLADVDEVLALQADALPPEAVLAAHCYRHEDLLRLGRGREAAAALRAADGAVERHPVPYWSWAVHTWRGLAANLAGDLERAEEVAVAAASRRPDVPEAQACLGVNLVAIRALQGRAAEVLDLLGSAVDAHPEVPCYRAVQALCATQAGEVALAERAYRWFADAGFTDLPEDTNRFLGLGVLAHTAVELGDAEGGRTLTGLLAPYRGQWILLNCYGGGGAHWGPTSHQLARLAVLDGRPEQARALFDEALDQAVAMAAPVVAERIAADAAELSATSVG